MSRACRTCGGPLPPNVSGNGGGGRRVCDDCKTAHLQLARRRRGRKRDPRTNAERGYGPEHVRRRRLAAALVAAGGAVCARCGLPIAPGAPWDLGHVDGDKTRHAGPEHRGCNRATNTAGRATSSGPPRQSRPW